MQTFFIKNLDCAACADKLEREIRKDSGVRRAHISFATSTLSIDCDNIESIQALITRIEPKVVISKKPQRSAFLTPQLFLLLTLIAIFLASLALLHWGLDTQEGLSENYMPLVIAIKGVWLAIYLISGRNVIKGAVRSFRRKEFFDENVLMLTASIAAFGIGAWEEAVSIMLFFATGEYLQEISVKKSKEAISGSANLVPSIAHKVVVEGNSPLTRHSAFSDGGNSSLTQSLNDLVSLASVITDEVTPSPHAQKHSNLTQDTRIAKGSNLESRANTESFDTSESSISDSKASTRDSKNCTEFNEIIESQTHTQGDSKLSESTIASESAVPTQGKIAQDMESTTTKDSNICGGAVEVLQEFSEVSSLDSKNIESQTNTQGNSKILSEKSGLRSLERGDKTRASIDEAKNKLPDLSQKAELPESLQDIDPKELVVGDIIILYAGEMLPCDATLLEDNASFNTAAISGESLPIESKRGDEILSGAIALNKAIKLQVLRPFEQSQIAKIADLIANATMQKSPTENFITTFARYYTPLVLLFALLLALIPPLFFAQSFEDWIYRALVVLMVSCPCALVVSVPIGYFGGLAAASKRGALIKGSNYLEALSKLSTIAFDKTGTLTKGVFEVIEVVPSEGFSKNDVLSAALCAQNLSNHPIAQSIKKTYNALAHTHSISEYEELSGQGVRAVCDSHEIIAGNDTILHTFDIAHNTCYVQGSVVHISRDKQYLGYILIADVLKDEASDVIAALKSMRIDSILLSGDGEYPCKMVADKLGCGYYHSLLPQDKVRIFSEIKASSSGKVAFVGDGINDAPSLALADVGVAMGSGSDISHQSADVIITNNSLQTLLGTIAIAKKTKTIIYENIAFALGIKGVFIVLGLFGVASIWEAVFGDVGVALLALANAMRCMRG